MNPWLAFHLGGMVVAVCGVVMTATEERIPVLQWEHLGPILMWEPYMLFATLATLWVNRQ